MAGVAAQVPIGPDPALDGGLDVKSDSKVTCED